MPELKLELHIEGFNAIRRDPAVQAELHRRGQQIAEAAGGGEDFEVIDSPSKSRARTIVITATTAGRKIEATSRGLSRALGAGSG